ncbi:MAG: AAA family ATPase [Calditrichia bacterium]
MQDIQKINEMILQESQFVESLQKEISKVIIGQKDLIDKVMICLLADGHVLLEGVPGLAKTLLIKTLAQTIKAKYHRIQFTPDLLPADILGTMIYNQKSGEFSIRKGPIFANFILADEINRAPAKVQSALLEAMQEKQVTIGNDTFMLEQPFLVLATQNPIEQEGTYPLPEAQVDRFMMKVLVTYPNKDEELQIIQRMVSETQPEVSPVIDPIKIIGARKVVHQIYMDEKIEKYIVDIVDATRHPQNYNLQDIVPFIEFGASPRASIYLKIGAKAHAFLKRRGYVTPDDIKGIAYEVLRHRIILTYEAEAEEKTTDDIIERILNEVEIP